MEENATPTRFYAYPQEAALASFLPILQPHLPYSNPIYGRIQAPHNIPSRHCLFASTLPPGVSSTPEVFTLVFSDRSRHKESQIWTFNSLITAPKPLSPSNHSLLTQHIRAAILFLKNTKIPEAPGWPFQPLLKFAILHETITEVVFEVCEPLKAIRYFTRWNTWVVKTLTIKSCIKRKRVLPEGFKVGRVPADQLDLVISTSHVPRQVATLLLQPSVGILNKEGKLAAWGYIGVDGSFATLYVMPEYRGNGLASYVAVELLGTLGAGGFTDLGYDGRSGFVLSDVHEGNLGSEGVMKSLGGKIMWESTYVHVDGDVF